MNAQEKKINRLSKLLTSVLKRTEKPNESYTEAYKRALQSLEISIQEEKNFNREQLQTIKQLEEEEKQRIDQREAMKKHHFQLLQHQIAERAANRATKSEKRPLKLEDLKNQEGYV